MGRKPKPELPENIRLLDTGKYGLQFEVQENGKTRRLSGASLLKGSPRSFDTIEDALKGRDQVREFLASTVDRETTVRGFWERWTDEDDWAWGTEGIYANRGRDSYVVYASRTRLLVERYGDRQIASITERDIAELKPRRSHLPTIALFFRNAMREGFVKHNPAETMARDANAKANDERAKRRQRYTPPKRAQIDAMLERAAMPCYPRSIYGWLLTGTETGMRCGELDGMRFQWLDGDVYDIQKQLHYRTGTLEDPKHEGQRKVVLPPEVMAEIERARAQDPANPWIWRNTYGQPWMQDGRDRWWHWCADGGAALRSLVGGATMKEATRHHWAWHALNILEIPVPKIAKLYGHKDGGVTLLAHYATVDNDAAIDAVRTARAQQPASLSARRRAA